MTVSRRLLARVLALVALVCLAAIVMQRYTMVFDRVEDASAKGAIVKTMNSESSPPDRSDPVLMPTSEDLITAELKAGDVTYDESLLARAYAIFGDPRLEPAFRSPVMNWEAAPALLAQIETKEATLSKDLLTALEPFRARPNDPISIVNRPREEVLKTQTLSLVSSATRVVMMAILMRSSIRTPARAATTTAVLASGRIITWGGVRPWTRPDNGGDGYSPFPILLWLGGLEQP